MTAENPYLSQQLLQDEAQIAPALPIQTIEVQPEGQVDMPADWSQFMFDSISNRVYRNGIYHSTLSSKLSTVFRLFNTHPNQIITREEIAHEISPEFDLHPKYPSVVVTLLRKKLTDDPEEAKQILTSVHSKGYMLVNRSIPVELIAEDPGFVDYHLRVKTPFAEEIEKIIDRVGNIAELRRLRPGVALNISLSAKSASQIDRVRATEYPQLPKVDELLPSFGHHDFVFDPNNNEIIVNDESISLTPIEANILFLLISNQDRLVPTDTILDYLGTPFRDANAKTLKVHMFNLRRKMRNNREDFESPIEAFRGRGFRLNSIKP